MPRFVVSDLPGRAVCAGMIGVGAVWLAGRTLTGGIGGGLEEFDVMAGVLVLFVPVVALLGARTIVVDDRGIEVTRRGRVVLARRLDEIAGVRTFGPVSRLIFKGEPGGWLLWFTAGQGWGPATDFIVERVGWMELPGAISLPASRICFPPVCVGCGAASGGCGTITARRGFDLVLWALHVERNIVVPACRRCRARRRRLGALFAFGPISTLFACILLLLTPVWRPPVVVIAALSLVAMVLLRNRGEDWADWLVWGVRGRLTPDNTVHLWCRDPAQQATIAACSGRCDTMAPPTRLGL